MIIILFGLALAEEVGLAKRPKLILLTLILSSTAFLDLMGDGKIDLTSTVPAIAAIYWMVANTRQSSLRIFLLIGFLTGLAMAARPFNIFLLALIIALYYIQNAFLKGKQSNYDKLRFLARTTLLIGVGIVCLLSYQFIENWIILGNPRPPSKTIKNSILQSGNGHSIQSSYGCSAFYIHLRSHFRTTHKAWAPYLLYF